ncbi:MAG: TRAP transporter large permease subunit [Deltaproteobacteria bacterium]|nr:TRAP transporter large permease subunit [Deltaproteobacteria bacterium]
MSIEWITLLIIFSFLTLLLLGLPLAFVTGSVAVIFTYFLVGPDGLFLIVTRIFTMMNNFILVAVPLFIFMACILERAGVAEDLFRTVYVWSGPLRGGLAIATVISCTIMAAMVGIIGAEITTFGLIALPAMFKRGYDKKLALGTVCVGGALATLIPPSVVFIMYGLVAGVSVGKLFIAGVLPGLMLASFYILYILIRAYLNPELAPAAPIEERNISFKQKMIMLKGLILPGFIVIGVLGSIYGGVATPTEAAGAGSLGAVISAAINRRLTWGIFEDSAIQTMKVTCMLIWLFFGASAIIGIYTLAGGAEFVKTTISGLPLGPLGIVIAMQIILIILGCFLDWIGILLLTMPLFVPIIQDLGFDPIWFGVLFCLNMQISYISPPFGPGVFYLKSVTPPEIKVEDIFGSIWPFAVILIFGLVLVITFPQIALWLPEKMIK